ncbi:MAG: hypothetical protein WD045_00850 [Pirellulaceae bacterium]
MFDASDDQILDDCLKRRPEAWNRFVDRSIPIVLRVIDQCHESQGEPQDHSRRPELARHVFSELMAEDFGLIRAFRRRCSWETYLTVITRRIVLARRLELDHLDRVTGATQGTLVPAR